MYEFKRPVGQPVSDKELEKWTDEAYNQSYEARRDAEVKWLSASAMLDGYPNHIVNWFNRTVDRNRHNPKGSIRVDIPEMTNRFRRELGRLLSILRPPTTAPISTGDPDIWRLNRMAAGACAYIFNNTEFKHTVGVTWLADVLMSGTAGLLPYWDNTLIDEFHMDEAGDINIRVIPSWQMFPTPSTAVDDSETKGMIWGYPVDEEWIKQNIPEALNEKQVEIATPYNALGGYYLGNTPAQIHGYLVRTVFLKPDRRFPEGEMYIMVGDKIYRRKGRLTYFLGGKRMIPISVARWLKKNTSWWGESFGYNVSRMNREINRMMTLEVRRAIIKAHPGYLMVPMGATNTEDFKNQIGGVIPFRPSLINPEGQRPYWLTPSPSTADADVILNRFGGYMEDVTSQHEATSGQAPGRADSAAAISSLIRQDMLPNEVTIQSIDKCLSRTMQLAITFARERWKAPRQATITGPTGAMPQTVMIDPSRIPDVTQLRIITGLDVPMDRPTMIEFLSQLASAPYRGGDPILSREEYLRGLAALGVSIPGVDLVSPDEESAWRENYLLYGDGEAPGQIAELMPSLEDSEVHLRVHKTFAASLELQTASEEVRRAFDYHIRETGMALSGTALPDEFDRAMVARDAQQMSDEIEAGQIVAPDSPMVGPGIGNSADQELMTAFQKILEGQAA